MTEVTARNRLAGLRRRANWSLSVTLTAVLLVPTLFAVAFGALGVADRARDASQLAAIERDLEVQAKTSVLLDQLQRERDHAAGYAQGNRSGDSAALRGAMAATDGAVDELTDHVGDASELTGASAAAFARVKEHLDRLIALREQVDRPGTDPAAVVAGYTGLTEALGVLESSLGRSETGSTKLAGMVTALASLGAMREQLTLQQTVIELAITRGEMRQPDADTVRAADARFGWALRELRGGLSGYQQTYYSGFATGPASVARDRLKLTALNRVNAPGQLGIARDEWLQAGRATLAELRTAEAGLRDEVTRSVRDQASAARFQAIGCAVILLLVVLGTAGAAYLVWRSSLRPLRRLTTSAGELARRDLPELARGERNDTGLDSSLASLPVGAPSEVGRLARAIHSVTEQAVGLAGQRAGLRAEIDEMLVNLSQRDYRLVERQLQLIEVLEREEKDGNRLARLFQLDYLATRLRRDSENLSVLAGGESVRRVEQPVPILDVLRAAASEIEQYQRLALRRPPLADLCGPAAGDVAHLLAELLENAVNFSPADTPVTVETGWKTDGALVVRIIDHGVGMVGVELIAANNQLAEPGQPGASATRRMGLAVVARLARRHGIDVQLSNTDSSGPGSGVTATVTIPASLVVAASDWTATEPAIPPISSPVEHTVDQTALVGAAAGAKSTSMPVGAAPGDAPAVGRVESRPEVDQTMPGFSPAGGHTGASGEGADAAGGPLTDYLPSQPSSLAGNQLSTAESPIFEEMTTGWIQRNWECPVSALDEADQVDDPVTHTRSKPGEPADRSPGAGIGALTTDTEAEPRDEAPAQPAAEPAAEVPAEPESSEREQSPAPADPAGDSVDDSVGAAGAGSPEPKREPASEPPSAIRDPQELRERLASYHQIIRQSADS